MPRKFFKIKFFFFTSWGSFPYKKEKKSFYEKFAGRQQYMLHVFLISVIKLAYYKKRKQIKATAN
jgi:hypothetical protein